MGIPSDRVDGIWNRVEPLVKKGLAEAIHEIGVDDVKRSIKAKEMQLWAGFDVEAETVVVVMVTEIINYPKMRVCHIVANGGERLEEWEPFMDKIKEWAISEGCVKIKAVARDGWVRRLKAYGYEKTNNVIECDLTEGAIKH